MTHTEAMDVRDKAIADGLFPTVFVNQAGGYSVHVFRDGYRAVCGTACGFTPAQIVGPNPGLEPKRATQ